MKSQLKAFSLLVTLSSFGGFAQSDSSTTLCNNVKGKEFFAQVDSCTALGQIDFFLQISDGNILKPTCDLITNRVSIKNY